MEENVEINVIYETQKFHEEMETKLKSEIYGLEERLETVRYDETGKISDNINELSPYYSASRESADLFRSYMIDSDINKLVEERRALEESKKEDRELLFIANKLLKEQQKLLKLKDKEISDLNGSFINISDESVEKLINEQEKLDSGNPSVGGTGVKEKDILEARKAERLKIVGELEYLKNEIENLNKSIMASSSTINLKNDLIRTLREEKSQIKERRNSRSNYLNLEEIRKDVAKLNAKNLELYYLQRAIKTFNDPLDAQIIPDEIVEVPEELEPIVVEGIVETPKQPEPIVVEGIVETPKQPEPIIVEGIVEKPKAMEDWKLDGFKLDFIEKFGYVPSYSEKELNQNYAGDYSSLISHPREAYEPFRPNLRERVVTGIKNIPSSVVDSIKRMTNKVFKSRTTDTDIKLEGPSITR